MLKLDQRVALSRKDNFDSSGFEGLIIFGSVAGFLDPLDVRDKSENCSVQEKSEDRFLGIAISGT